MNARDVWKLLFFSAYWALSLGALMTVYCHAILLAPWQIFGALPGMSPLDAALPGALVVLLCGLPLVIWGWRHLRLWDPPASEWTSRDLFGLAFVVLTGLILWSIHALPVLDRPANTFGDEDGHFLATREYLAWFQTMGGDYPYERTLRLFFQRPGLLYLLSLPFANDLPAQRTLLLIPFLATIVGAWVCARLFTKRKSWAHATGLLAATSPLLLAYTMDRYPDILHPPFLLCAGIAGYVTLKRQNPAAMVALASSVICICFVKHNLLPTCILMLLWLLPAAWKQRTSLRTLAPILATGLLTTTLLLSLYLVIRHFDNLDQDRLSFFHLSQQRYDLLVIYSPLYLPWTALLIPVVVGTAWKQFRKNSDTSELFFSSVLIAGLLVQLLLYGLFQPGWMPWSRNYLMFWSQLIILASMAIAPHCPARALRIRMAVTLTALTIVVQLWLGASQLKRNTIFHECEIWYDFPSWWTELDTEWSERIGNETVYMNAPLYPPLSQQDPIQAPFRVQWLLPPDARLVEDKINDWEVLSSLFPDNAQWAIFHYHEFRSRVSKLHRWNVPPPRKEPSLGQVIGEWRICSRLEDPLSEGTSGVLLLQKEQPR